MADSMFGDIGKVTGDVVSPVVNGGIGSELGHVVEAMVEINGQLGQMIGQQEGMHDLLQHTIDSLHVEAVPDATIAPDAPMIEGHELAHDTSYDATHDASHDVYVAHDAPVVDDATG